jgi:hypothetical protein
MIPGIGGYKSMDLVLFVQAAKQIFVTEMNWTWENLCVLRNWPIQFCICNMVWFKVKRKILPSLPGPWSDQKSGSLWAGSLRLHYVNSRRVAEWGELWVEPDWWPGPCSSTWLVRSTPATKQSVPASSPRHRLHSTKS